MANLPEIDITAIADELEVDSRARSDASRNLPDTDQTSLGNTEQLIVDRINNLNNVGRSAAEETVRKFAQDFAEIDLPGYKRKIIELPDYIRRHVDRALDEHRAKLIELRVRERRYLSSLNAFEDEHGLDEPAEYPESKIFHWAVVVAMVLVESIANSYFFAKGSDLGLIGGALQALLISAVNIGMALLAGNYLIRNFHHIAIPRRMIAGLGIAFYIFFVLVLNLATAHYRALLEHDPTNALVLTIPSLTQSPFGFNNFDAAILFFIGILFAVAAMIKSYKADAFYPGHGPIDRRHKYANEDYKDARNAARKHAHEILDDGAKYAGQFQVEAKKAAYQQTVIVNQLDQFAGEYERFNNSLKEALYSLLKSYRDKNSKVRTTPAPKYFSEFPELQTNSDLPMTNLEKDRQTVAEAESYLADVQKLVSTFTQNLVNLDKSINKEIDDFIFELEKEAERERSPHAEKEFDRRSLEGSNFDERSLN